MIRRNLWGQFYSWIVFLAFMTVLVATFKYFDLSKDWQDGPALSTTALNLVIVGCIIIAFMTFLFTLHGQLISKTKRLNGFAILILFGIWVSLLAILGLILADKFYTDNDVFGPRQQLLIVALTGMIMVGTYVYTFIKFPEYKDVEYIKEFIDKEIDRALYKPDIVCAECGAGLKEEWEFCPSCGGMVIDDDALTVQPILVEDEMPLSSPPPKKRGFFRRSKSKKEEMVMDEEPPLEEDIPDDPLLDDDDDFVDDLKQKEEPKKKEKAPKKKESEEESLTRVKCEECSSLLEIRNPKRPLHVRCPSCKHIWLLEE